MFKKNNEPFVCIACGRKVEKHPTSSRNHCNYCLTSLHVDIDPGDRKNTCRGQMDPVGLDMKSGKTQVIYKCEKCGKMGKNIVADDDNQEILIELSTKLL